MGILKRIKYAWQPKMFALHLACRECNQRLDTKNLTENQAIAWLDLWNTYHKKHNVNRDGKSE